jgi:formate-dependent nitrite reductase cytochrome c552 subunit
MSKSIVAFSIVLSVLLIMGVSSNFAFAQNGKIKLVAANEEKKKTVDKAKAFAEEMRKKVLEKYHNDYKSKKEDSKKQIALDAKKKLSSSKKLTK